MSDRPNKRQRLAPNPFVDLEASIDTEESSDEDSDPEGCERLALTSSVN
jgi:hypothetical protein